MRSNVAFVVGSLTGAAVIYLMSWWGSSQQDSPRHQSMVQANFDSFVPQSKRHRIHSDSELSTRQRYRKGTFFAIFETLQPMRRKFDWPRRSVKHVFTKQFRSWPTSQKESMVH